MMVRLGITFFKSWMILFYFIWIKGVIMYLDVRQCAMIIQLNNVLVEWFELQFGRVEIKVIYGYLP